MFDVNYLAILVAGVVSMVIGALWYSPILFGDLWLKEMDLSEAKKKKMEKMNSSGGGMAIAYGVNFLTVLVTIYTLAFLFDFAGAVEMKEALTLTFWAWLGFLFMWQVGGMIWGGNSLKLTVLNGAYNLITLLISAAILVSW